MAFDKEIGLTEKQERFCQEYLIDLNGAKAAIRAGYSERSAKEEASRLLTNDNVSKRLCTLRKPLAEKVGITQEMVLNEFAKIGFSNIQDYFNGDLTAKDLMKVDPDKAQAIGSVKRTTFSNDSGETEVIEFKMHDKIKALESIGKHLGFFENDNKQKKDEAIKAPIINVYQSGPPLSGSEKDVK